MRGSVYIENMLIGEVDFRILDLSTGNIGGTLFPSENYHLFKSAIQQLTITKGLADYTDFNFSATFIDHTRLEPYNTITITDYPDFDEVYVECEGVPESIIKKVAEHNSH
jgi:hypothetical protein